VPADLVEYLVKGLVANPDEVRISAAGGRQLQIDVVVNPADMGRVIGRGGRVIKAIRTLARAAGGASRRVQVDVRG
jgi:predicted RNA-binding protein YlqC (UPF0109 family)